MATISEQNCCEAGIDLIMHARWSVPDVVRVTARDSELVLVCVYRHLKSPAEIFRKAIWIKNIARHKDLRE